MPPPQPPPPVRSVSYGGGVQSTALLVLAAQGRIDFPLFLFSNVGDDSEHPDTIRYVHEVAVPYAAAHGIELVELHRRPARGATSGPCSAAGETPDPAPEGTPSGFGICHGCGVRVPADEPIPTHDRIETLYGRLTRTGSRSLPIPVRMDNGAPGNRACTADFKVRVVGRELKARGASETNPAITALGISVDEIERAKPGRDPRSPYQVIVYPLLDLGLSRNDCRGIIETAGLAIPPKSACWFCPFHDLEAWRRLKRDTPALFARACDLEAQLNVRRDELGKDHVWLTRRARPLADTVDDQLTFDGMDGCDSGYCMT